MHTHTHTTQRQHNIHTGKKDTPLPPTHTQRKQRPSFTRTRHSTNIKLLDRGMIRNRGSMEGSGKILFQSKLGVRNSRMGERHSYCQNILEYYILQRLSRTVLSWGV